MAKPDWHHLVDKKTGDAQVVASLDGIDLERFEVAKLARAPKMNERVERGGALKADPDHAKKARDLSTIGHLTHADLVAIIQEQVALAIAAPRTPS